MIRILAVGRVKDKRLAALADGFLQRLHPMAAAEVIELKDSQPEREGRDMVAKLGSAGGHQLVIALDEHGEDITSQGLADILGAQGNIVFLVGGADGLGATVRQRADRTLRLSSLTLTHEMARVLLLEQIYRGLSILRGKPYHRA